MKKFADKRTKALFDNERVKSVSSSIAWRAHDGLQIIANLTDLRDLQAFPGMRLEHLAGDRKGQCSVRINTQWRICFVWNGREAMEIEFVDYH